MNKNEDVSGGFSSIPRSDLKIGGNEMDERQDLSKIQHCNNTMLNSGNSEMANEMPQIGTVSQSFGKEENSNKSELLGQDVDSEKQGLVKRNDAVCVEQKRNGLDLNEDAVSTCLNNDISSVCSSRRRDKSSSTEVYSECGSSSVAPEKDPMKLWKAMKQNGFLSNPKSGGFPGTSSSCLVSSSHGGIPAPRKRGRKSKNNNNNNTNNDAAMVKKRKIEIARKEEVDRFARLAAPSGLLNELNPGIINHVRNKKQVLSIIENIVKSERDSGNFYRPHHHPSIWKNMDDVNTDNASRYDKHSSMRYYEESEENNTVGSRFQVTGQYSENVSSLSSEDSADLNCASVLTVKAATVASQWLELLHQDIKGRVSALKRSKRRVRQVLTIELPFLVKKELSDDADQENDPNLLLNGSSSASNVDVHKTRWMALFNQLEQTLSEEEKQLESWLNHVRELQSHCDQGLQHLSLSSGQNFLQLGMPLDSRATEAMSSDKDLVVRAAAASIYSTCNFLASKENITCS